MQHNKTVTELPPIDLGKRPNVLLVGNGINLAYGSCVSSKDLITNALMRNRPELTYRDVCSLPFPMQMVAATNNDVRTEMKHVKEEMCAMTVPDEQKAFINRILAGGFDAILTTNYSPEIEKTVFGDGWKPRYMYTKKDEDPQRDFCNYRYVSLAPEYNASLWHIHGIAYNADTMIIGHYYYGRLLARITEYAAKLIGTVKRAANNDGVYRPATWIDYFLLGDIYMMGFSLAFTESDIWWLLDYKSRHSEELFNAKTVIFNPDLSNEKRALLKTFKCDIRENVRFDNSAAYREFYERALDDIASPYAAAPCPV